MRVLASLMKGEVWGVKLLVYLADELTLISSIAPEKFPWEDANPKLRFPRWVVPVKEESAES